MNGDSRQRPAVLEPTGIGPLLRRWRESRRLTQLELALDARVSTRHLSFLESGRATPSREMLIKLSNVLDVPLREPAVGLPSLAGVRSGQNHYFSDLARTPPEAPIPDRAP